MYFFPCRWLSDAVGSLEYTASSGGSITGDWNGKAVEGGSYGVIWTTVETFP